MRTGLAIWMLVGCRPVDPAPDDLDGLTHYSWAHFEDESPAPLEDVIGNLHVAINGDSFEENIEGGVTHLTPEAISVFGRDVDPTNATGVILVDWIDCTSEEIEALLAYPAQDELYVGVYDLYERDSTAGIEAFLDGTSDTVGWDLLYTSGVLGVKYTVESRTLMRRVMTEQHGPALVARSVMMEPAVFEKEDSNNEFFQDYHFEIYWPHDGGLLHMYALWKDIKLLGFEDEEEGIQRLVLNNLVDWDEGTSQICTNGIPDM